MLPGGPLGRDSHPLCRLKIPTLVLSSYMYICRLILQILRGVQCTPPKNNQKLIDFSNKKTKTVFFLIFQTVTGHFFASLLIIAFCRLVSMVSFLLCELLGVYCCGLTKSKSENLKIEIKNSRKLGISF